MGLDVTDKGILEEIIKHAVETIPTLLPSFKSQQVKSKFQIVDPDEFCYGFTHGKIFAEFAVHYATKHGFRPKPDIIDEIRDVLENRSSDIKDAIVNCG